MTPKTEAERAAEELDHPCKQTCSGWKQGYEKGFSEGEKSERVMKLVEALKFYADCPSNSGMIEGVINGGEYVPLGTLAKQAIAEFEGNK